jgi:DNA-directed RNA polymerase specialized sigma subunit
MLEVSDTSPDLNWVLGKLAAARKVPSALPVVSAEQKQKDLKAKQPKELELWKAWKASGEKPALLEPLLKSFAPLINSRINLYRRAEIPTAALEQEHHKWFLKGLQTYDPKKGAQLNTHLTTNLKKAGRWIEANKNFSYISENISKNIGAYNNFKSELTERLGYEPDDHTIRDFAIKEKHPKLGLLSVKDIKRINKEQRQGLIEKGHESDLLSNDEVSPRDVEVAHLIIPQLTPQERMVHEYTLGLNGKPALKPGAIAKKLKMDNSKVAKLRSAVWNKMKPYLGDS